MDAADVRLWDWGPHDGGPEGGRLAAQRLAVIVSLVCPQASEGHSQNGGLGTIVTFQRRLFVLTSRAIIPDLQTVYETRAYVDFFEGQEPVEVVLKPDWLFVCDDELDFTLVACEEASILLRPPVSLDTCVAPEPGHVLEVWRSSSACSAGSGAGSCNLDRCFKLVESSQETVLAFFADDERLLLPVGSPLFVEATPDGHDTREHVGDGQGSGRQWLFAGMVQPLQWRQAEVRRSDRTAQAVSALAVLKSAGLRMPIATMKAAMGDRRVGRQMRAGACKDCSSQVWQYFAAPAATSCAASVSVSSDSREYAKKLVVRIGGVAVLSEALVMFGDAAALQADCCNILAEVVLHSSANAAAVVEGKVIAAACAAMHAHAGDDKVQAVATRLLSRLAAFPEHRPALVAAGAAEAACRGMARHAGNAQLQEGGCALIRQLLQESRLRGRCVAEHATVVAAFLAMRGLDLVSTLMAVHADSASVQLEACALLERLSAVTADAAEEDAASSVAGNREVCSAVLISGCLEAACRSLAEFPQDAVLAGHILAAMVNMARSDPEAERYLLRAGAAELAADAAARHMRSAAVQEHAQRLLQQVAAAAAPAAGDANGVRFEEPKAEVFKLIVASNGPALYKNASLRAV
eukprot:TRINITY_DN27533_c0_g1_i1.p1 TRINITY_DN27533_c0_g1~~TRINITY_DN27533_c0_g1_i1.p1  ORF type:complete len:636 (+),score=154.12 TRINITY_DN27533_c0_g1_i1:96-2003(+)